MKMTLAKILKHIWVRVRVVLGLYLKLFCHLKTKKTLKIEYTTDQELAYIIA